MFPLLWTFIWVAPILFLAAEIFLYLNKNDFKFNKAEFQLANAYGDSLKNIFFILYLKKHLIFLNCLCRQMFNHISFSGFNFNFTVLI